MGKPFFETHISFVMTFFLSQSCDLLVYLTGELTIPSNSFNDYSSILDLSHFPLIEKVFIGDGSFKNTPSLILDNMALLKSVTIGESSFEQTREIVFGSLNRTWYS